MSIINEHLPYYRQIFKIPKIFKENILLIGLPYIEGSDIPSDFKFSNLIELIHSKGIKKVFSADLFDKNSDFQWDLNLPIPKKYHHKFNLLIDIGTIEHIYDARQCLSNYFNLISLNGYFVLVTPINGYFRHGFHVFNPEFFTNALKVNGFKIIYQKYSTSTGVEIKDPSIKTNNLIWLVAKKVKNSPKFIIPQQEYWKEIYNQNKSHYVSSNTSISLLTRLKRFIWSLFPSKIKTKIYEYIHQ